MRRRKLKFETSVNVRTAKALGLPIGRHARSGGRGHRIGERRPLLTQSGRHPREGPFRIAGLRAAVVNWRDEASRIGLYQARPWPAC
jgi:hypothetical protein